ncbi:hypothetical protein BST97_10595 [Nonlabens spongiae]|uniref:DUF4190 domain-containing protein n=1 Tax=Nonlabens spongiae TaxID=331648 RepID=A0A1W6MLC1_9FLAO|nr:hypothetical protein [Nonlabens spongiae]ARN78398.1 hypothetical protein BST97_10595 [Nonlabens spongiae]
MENSTNSGFDNANSNNPERMQSNQGGFGNDHLNAKLPADPTSMTLAIIALCLFVICCCVGGYYISLILSIIGLVLANSSIRRYNESPQDFDPNSLRKVQSAKTFNLVMLIVSAVVVVLGILSMIMNFAFLDRDLLEEIMEQQGIEMDSMEEYDSEDASEDTYQTTEDDWEYEEDPEPESIETDSILN